MSNIRWRHEAEDVIEGTPLSKPDGLLRRLTLALEQAYKLGMEKSSEASYDNGYQDGLDDTNTREYNLGRAVGLDAGMKLGYNDGYTIGFEDGIAGDYQ